MEAPHLLILDEPTNHLDIDSRRALLDALNDYEGAVILITHDRSLMELVADRLWLAADGTVKPFDGDMDDYAKLRPRPRPGHARAPTQVAAPAPPASAPSPRPRAQAARSGRSSASWRRPRRTLAQATAAAGRARRALADPEALHPRPGQGRRAGRQPRARPRPRLDNGRGGMDRRGRSLRGRRRSRPLWPDRASPALHPRHQAGARRRRGWSAAPG